MKILYIADFLYFDVGGAKMSARIHLRTLQEIYGAENIRVAALIGSKGTRDKIDNTHMVFTTSGNPIRLFLNCLAGYGTFINRHIIMKILTMIKEEKINVVFVDNSIYGILVMKIKQIYPCMPIISYYHDVKAVLGKEWRQHATILKRPVYSAMIKNERINQKFCDVNLTLNSRETERFAKEYKYQPEGELRVYLDIPFTFNVSNRPLNSDRLDLLFIGSSYTPNIKGINWFIDNVLSELKGDIYLTVAGSGMDRKYKERDYPSNVCFYGKVDDLSELYCSHDVIICPIFEGAGMKVKVAEAMGYGKIIIGTQEDYIGYKESVDVDKWNKFFYHCNDANEFIESINSISANVKSIKRYNPEVRNLYEKNFSIEYGKRTIESMIELAVKKTNS